MASAAQTIGILSALATLALYAVWFVERRAERRQWQREQCARCLRGLPR